MGTGRLVIMLAALVLAAVGCGKQAPAGSGGSSTDELRGRTFLSTAVTEDGRPRPLVAGSKVSLWFTDDGRLVANAGCNTLSGQVRLDGGRIEIADGDFSMTEMGCDAPRHQQDEWLATLLQEKPSWRLDGDDLIVISGTTELTLVDKKVAEPDLPLEGTRWTLETIFMGQTAAGGSNLAAAYLVFADGKVTGSTGCNSLDGPATVTDSTISFGQLVTTDKACPAELAGTERTVLSVLRGEVPYTIDSNQLRLNPQAEQGLGLRGSQG